MILVDTSVWVDHLRVDDSVLADLLDEDLVLAHPFVIGEIALGNLRRREAVLKDLARLPKALVATDAEVLHFIAEHALAGSGCGYVDVHLLAAALLTGSSLLWTHDKRLDSVAARSQDENSCSAKIESKFIDAPRRRTIAIDHASHSLE